ncbi:flp pilus-assembly TadE/G-like family protein [Corynebacterium sp.]|uniref:flp pilus-assembly TadE/G-like family protein n=1 Tax=Corynebacterium sp. TaxID=1720 RepID=UPI0026DBAE8C|nr:flp pilus-assembly TadE/G-like family protein [Corynebacterium sp.]MDO4915630.1 flp pilus-assembly TadE/G-like family protein [Corynebacterium sp.]
MTVVGAVVCTVVIGVFGTLVAVGAKVIDSRKADRAADLSALAAAYALQETIADGDHVIATTAPTNTHPENAVANPGPENVAPEFSTASTTSTPSGMAATPESSAACALAGQVAAENDASLRSCTLEGEDVIVSVEVSGAHSPFTASASARAGPA